MYKIWMRMEILVTDSFFLESKHYVNVFRTNHEKISINAYNCQTHVKRVPMQNRNLCTGT